ncbi:MAG: hypothetical protein IKN85_04960 [Oscillospiraceae bacterium]|nr:hypothetical protein [Oscillospiraceae bacterium]
MKKRKSLFLCILAGIMSCSYTMTASAGSFVNGGQLKNGLLIRERDNGNYHIADYNTNDDNVVNVLDLCRVKAGLFTKDQPEKQNIYIKSSGPWISDDKSQITVPVQINGNVLGVSAVSFRVAYNSGFFTLSNAYSSNNAKVSFSKGSDQIQYSAPGGRNLSSEGYFVYLVFDVASSVPAGKYDIELDDIQAAMNTKDGKVKEISKEECNIDDRLSFDFYREEPVTTTVTDPVVTTVTTTVTTVPETTAAPVTTVTKAETKPEPPKSDELSFYMDNAELSGDGRKLKVPVYMNGNKEGICNFNTIVKYDRNKFVLTGIERAEYEGWGYITGNGDNAVFNTNNNANIKANSGVIAYLNFDIRDGVNQNSYSFELTDIKASKSENWNQKNIDKCRRNSEVYEFKFDGSTPAATTVPQITTAVTTTITEPPVTTTVTTVTEPPAVTTTVKVTAPPVVTTAAPAPDDFQYEVDPVKIEIADLINADRTAARKQTLTINKRLCAAADKRAAELAQKWDNARPNGGSLYDLFREYGVSVGGESHVYTSVTTSVSEIKKAIDQTKVSTFDSSYFNAIGIGHVYIPESQYKNYWAIIVCDVK